MGDKLEGSIKEPPQNRACLILVGVSAAATLPISILKNFLRKFYFFVNILPIYGV